MTAAAFILAKRPPRRRNGVAWVDPVAMQVKKWKRGRWQAVARVTATAKT